MFPSFRALLPVAYASLRNLLRAFFPAVVLGLAFGDYIEVMRENAVIVAWALVIGGFAILLVERFAKTRDVGSVANVSARQSILVGLVQCIAMIPGVSRSGATILGAMSLDRKSVV